MARAPTFAFLTALLLALCVGAIWPVVAMFSRGDAAWMAILAGVVAIGSVGMLAIRRAWLRTMIAIALTLVSIAYAEFLIAAAAVTAVIGLPYRAVVATMGPEMAFALARTRLSRIDVAMIVAGVALAAIGAWRRAQPSRSPPSGP